jgi:outer membrane lipoprotein-sorting protein
MYYGNLLRKYFPLVIGLFIAVSFTGNVLAKSGRQVIEKRKNPVQDGEKSTDEVFKNIKAMNGQPASQLIPAMHFFEAALGFNCGNCHVRGSGEHDWDFAKDDKPEKRRTREMITMMNTINKESFKGEQLVTCFTCHRGSPDPTAIPALMTASSMKEKRNEPDEEVIKIPNRLGTAEEIISTYQQAIGGKEAFEKITSLKLEGKADMGNGRESSVSVFEKAPNLYYSETKAPQGTMQKVFNGEAGWFKSPQFQRKLEGDDLQDLKLSSDFYAPLNFAKNYSDLKLENVQLLDNDTVYAVEGTFSKYRRFEFFFDATSGLLLRQIQYSHTLFGDLQIQTDYKDYRNVDGVLFPFELDVSDYEHTQQYKYDSITPNATVDDKIFEASDK